MTRRKTVSNQANKKNPKSDKPFSSISQKGEFKTGKVPLSVRVYAPYRPAQIIKEEQQLTVSKSMSKLEQPAKGRWLNKFKGKKEKVDINSPEIEEKISYAQERKKNTFEKKRTTRKQVFVIEKEKLLLMWSGVVFFMIVIVFSWLFSLDNIFSSNELKNAIDQPTELKNAAKEISAAMSELKKGLGEIKIEIEKRATTTPVAAISPVANLPIGTSTISADDIMKLKEKLESLDE